MPPPVNHVVFASGAVVAVSVIAIAAAAAAYESPEVQRFAEDVRRRINTAFTPAANRQRHRGGSANGEPRFNRPEDAGGFFESRRGAGAEPEVDADEETRRKQRDELMYWNSVRLRNQEEKDGESPRTPGTSFDDFLKQDDAAETGTFVYNTGTDLSKTNANTLRHRGDPAANAALYANPFADEHHIDMDEMTTASALETWQHFEEGGASDIYSATTRDDTPQTALTEQLIDVDETSSPITHSQAAVPTESSRTLDQDAHESQEASVASLHRAAEEPYASIQAWAHDSSRNFYSPLPETPAGPMSDPELISDGEMTPTSDSASLAGSGEDVANDVLSSRDGDGARAFDVMSESEGILTPASWSEVGSVISDNEGPMYTH